MKPLEERITEKVESIFCGLYYVHDLIIESINEAIAYYTEITPEIIYQAIDKVYSIPAILHDRVMQIIEEEMNRG